MTEGKGHRTKDEERNSFFVFRPLVLVKSVTSLYHKEEKS